jgi:hypothetical protein
MTSAFLLPIISKAGATVHYDALRESYIAGGKLDKNRVNLGTGKVEEGNWCTLCR